MSTDPAQLQSAANKQQGLRLFCVDGLVAGGVYRAHYFAANLRDGMGPTGGIDPKDIPGYNFPDEWLKIFNQARDSGTCAV